MHSKLSFAAISVINHEKTISLIKASFTAVMRSFLKWTRVFIPFLQQEALDNNNFIVRFNSYPLAPFNMRSIDHPPATCV